MNRIVFALLAFVLVHLGNSQRLTADCVQALSTVNPTCAKLLHNPDPSACTEACYRQFSKVASACEDSVDGQEYVQAYNQLGQFCDPCTTASVNLDEDQDCTDALDKRTAEVCSGSCRALVNAFISACPDQSAAARAVVNQQCGGANAGSTLKALEITTLLFVAICALIFKA